MNQEHLIVMANQIGEFFASMPDREEALAGVADHFRRFWEPRMRRAILATLDTASREALCPIVRQALASCRIELAPAQA